LARIPSTEKTKDFIYRVEVKKGTPLHDPNAPTLLVFEDYVAPAGAFHSLDVTVLRDEQPAPGIDLCSFEHMRERNMSYVKFIFNDATHCVLDHDYLLTMILRYFDLGSLEKTKEHRGN
jgi:hypothetical protein